MAADEIAGMIGPDVLARIKAQDPHPIIKAFVVGHEGESQGHMVGVGNVVKRWFRDAVEQLHNKISAGLQLFHGHGATNDHAGRQPIGEVVGKRIMKIGERLSSVVACWIYPDFRHLPLDVASIEAYVTMDDNGRGGLVAAQVDDVTGIALGNSNVNRPGFAGATLLGQLQAFADKRHIKENLMDLTLEDVRAYLAQEKVKPSALFSVEDLTADPVIAQMREKSPSNYEFARMRRELTEAEKKLADAEREKKDLSEKVKSQDAEISAGRLATAKQKVGQLFEAQKASRKLDDRQIKFIQNRLARFTPQKPEEIEKEFGSFLDQEIDEYGKIAKDVFGVPEPKPGEGDGGGREPGKGDANKDVVPDHLDPAKNPMIPRVI